MVSQSIIPISSLEHDLLYYSIRASDTFHTISIETIFQQCSVEHQVRFHGRSFYSLLRSCRTHNKQQQFLNLMICFWIKSFHPFKDAFTNPSSCQLLCIKHIEKLATGSDWSWICCIFKINHISTHIRQFQNASLDPWKKKPYAALVHADDGWITILKPI